MSNILFGFFCDFQNIKIPALSLSLLIYIYTMTKDKKCRRYFDQVFRQNRLVFSDVQTTANKCPWKNPKTFSAEKYGPKKNNSIITHKLWRSSSRLRPDIQTYCAFGQIYYTIFSLPLSNKYIPRACIHLYRKLRVLFFKPLFLFLKINNYYIFRYLTV